MHEGGGKRRLVVGGILALGVLALFVGGTVGRRMGRATERVAAERSRATAAEPIRGADDEGRARADEPTKKRRTLLGRAAGELGDDEPAPEDDEGGGPADDLEGDDDGARYPDDEALPYAVGEDGEYRTVTITDTGTDGVERTNTYGGDDPRIITEIRGVVRYHGQPAAGAAVDLVGIGDRETATTDGEGRFVLRRLLTGWHTVRAVKDDHLSALATVNVRYGKPANVVLDLENAPTIDVRVLGPDGAAVAKALVEVDVPHALVKTPPRPPDATLDTWNDFPYREQAEARTDATGHARLRLHQAGPHQVKVTHPEHGATGAVVEVDLAREVIPLSFRFDRGVAIVGQVVDASGAPIRTLVNVNLNSRDGAFASRSTKHRYLTTRDGTYTFRAVPPGRWILHVRATGWVRAEREVEIAPNAGDTTVRFVLEKGGSIRGRMVDASGRPSPGDVCACEDRPDLPPPLRSPIDCTPGTALADGAFVVEGLGASRAELYAGHCMSIHGRSLDARAAVGATDVVLVVHRRGE